MRIGLVIETVTHLALALTTTPAVAFAIFFVFAYLGILLDIPEEVRNLSPFEHVPGAPVETITAGPLLMLAAVAAALAGIGLLGWRRRDVG